MGWFKKKINEIKEKGFGKTVELYNCPEATLALEDVTLLLSYIFDHHEEILSNNDIPLETQFHNIVIKKTIYEISLSID